MAISVRQMFNTAGESTSLSDMNKGTSAAVGGFTPDYDGRLIGVIIDVGEEAATSLVEDVRVELSCTLWKPNKLEFGAKGSGLRTAPGVQLKPTFYTVDQEAKANKEITGQYIHDSGSPVTSRIRVWGVFQH